MVHGPLIWSSYKTDKYNFLKETVQTGPSENLQNRDSMSNEPLQKQRTITAASQATTDKEN